MTEVERVSISHPVAIALALVLCLAIVIRRRVDIGVGIYCATSFWGFGVLFGPTILPWVMAATTAIAAVVATVFPREGHRGRKALLPEDPGFIAWIAVLLSWTLLVGVFAYPSDLSTLLWKDLAAFAVFPLVMVLLFVRRMNDVRGLIWSFVLTSIVAGMVSVAAPTEGIRPASPLATYQFEGLGQTNYLTFAIPFGLASILGLAVAMGTRRRPERIVAAGSVVVAVVILAITGARQSAIGLLGGVALLVMWYLGNRGASERVRLVAGAAFVLLLGAGVQWYLGTEMATRWEREQVGGSYAARALLWQNAWERFLESPLIGNGWTYVRIQGGWAHNLFLDVLAATGLVGLFLFLGYAAWILRGARGAWRGGAGLEIDALRMGLAACTLFVFVQQMSSGGLSSHHIYWVPALLWRVAGIARRHDAAARAGDGADRPRIGAPAAGGESDTSSSGRPAPPRAVAQAERAGPSVAGRRTVKPAPP